MLWYKKPRTTQHYVKILDVKVGDEIIELKRRYQLHKKRSNSFMKDGPFPD